MLCAIGSLRDSLILRLGRTVLFEKGFNCSQSLRFLVLYHERILCGTELLLWGRLIVPPHLRVFSQRIYVQVWELLSEVQDQLPLARPSLRPLQCGLNFSEHSCFFTGAAPSRL